MKTAPSSRPKIAPLGVALIPIALAPLTAADWPQWRGPNWDGKVADNETYAHPVPAGRGIYIKDQQALALFTLK